MLVYKHRNNRLCLNVAYFLRKIKPSRVNNSRILSINTKSDKTLNISRTKFIFFSKNFLAEVIFAEIEMDMKVAFRPLD